MSDLLLQIKAWKNPLYLKGHFKERAALIRNSPGMLFCHNDLQPIFSLISCPKRKKQSRLLPCTDTIIVYQDIRQKVSV
jgi:hypothetical protein